MSRKKAHSGIDYWKIVRLFISIGLMIFLLFAISNKLNETVGSIKISIDSKGEKKKLITEKEVRAILKYEMGYDVQIAEISQLNLFKLEKVLAGNDRIDDVKVYLDKHNFLNVNIVQKEPIVRIDNVNAPDYYLDYKGDRVPVTDTYRVPVVTGNVDAYSSDFHKSKKNNLNDVLALAQKVHDDAFLNALVEQIHIDEKNEITIIPKVGRDKILIGQIQDLDEKIYKLKTYYEHGVKKIGLDRFDELDLKYADMMIGRQKDT